MARVYATADALIEWLGDYPPVNVVALLTRASEDVDEALVGVRYDVDDDGLPTDTGVQQALSGAVCAQVTSWLPPDVPGADDGPARLARVSEPGRTPQMSGVKVMAPECCDLAPRAARILHVAGLQPSRPWVFG